MSEPKIDHKFLRRLKADLKESAQLLDRQQARYLVDLYYQIQEFRKALKNQERSAENEPNVLVSWLGEEFKAIESYVKESMGEYASTFEVGRWSQSLVGIGPVLSAGLIAHIDIERAETAGGIWRYAGADPTVKWEKGQKRPWNAKLKTLRWKIADCLIKFSNHPDNTYGPIYRQIKERLIERNEAGEFKAAAAEKAEKVGKNTIAYSYYKKGLLPPAHVQGRAMRQLGKLFLSHWHEVAFYDHYKRRAPVPYILAHGTKHAHYIPVPNYEFPE